MKIASILPAMLASHLAGKTTAEESVTHTNVIPASAQAVHRPSSPLEDSMEEVSMTFAEQMERKSKLLNQRRVISQPGSRLRLQIERIEKLDELLQLLDHPHQERLETQTQRMRALLLGNVSPGLDELLQAAGDDPTRCDVLLRHVLQHAQHTQNSDLENHALYGLELLHKEKGPEVCAGLNTASAIAGFSTDPEQKQAIRQLYYQTIVHLQSGNAMLDELLGKFGVVNFTQGLRTLQRALTDDIAARSTSIPRRALQKILSSLQDASNISQTLTTSKQLLERLASKLPAVNLNAMDLTRRLLNLSGNGAYLRDLQDLAQDVSGQQPQHQLLFFSGLVPLVQNLPQGLWKDDQVKNRQMALNLLHTLIAECGVQGSRASLTPSRAPYK